MIQDRFSSENAYIVGPLLQTARSNQGDLQVITREQDQLAATSVFIRQQGLTANPANPVPNVTLVAQQTIGVALDDGRLSPDGQPIPPFDPNREQPQS